MKDTQTQESRCELCGREWREDWLRQCARCGKRACWQCAPHVEPMPAKKPRRRKGQPEDDGIPRLCRACFRASVLEVGCATCAPYDPRKTPCHDCPLPLERRDFSDDFLQRVYDAAATETREDVPRLSNLWQDVKRRTCEQSQDGRGWRPEEGEEVEDRPDVRAARIPLDRLAARLARLGLPFRYDVTQANVAALAHLLSCSGEISVCTECGAVASASGTYGWCWCSDRRTLCPYHADVDAPERPAEWAELAHARLDDAIWQGFAGAVERARAAAGSEWKLAASEERPASGNTKERRPIFCQAPKLTLGQVIFGKQRHCTGGASKGGSEAPDAGDSVGT